VSARISKIYLAFRTKRLVHSLGYRYRLHVARLPGKPDLVFASRRKVINVSGCFWHMHGCGRCRIPAVRRGYWLAKLTRNAERDRRVRRQLGRLGWRVCVIWECQVRRANLAERIVRFLDG
jgi:DNA mismatch endonuclease (patch repair protein)